MSQEPTGETRQETPATQPSMPAAERAEQLMTKWGFNVGLAVGMTRRRLQNMMTAMREEADRMDIPKQKSLAKNGKQPSGTGASQEPGQPTESQVTVRAEKLVDDITQRVGTFMLTAGHQVRRSGAFVREDAEDIWAEAQSIRQQRRGSSAEDKRQAER